MASILARSKIQEAGYFVVCEQLFCFNSLKNQLSINDKRTNQIINILQGLGIIAKKRGYYEVLVKDINQLEILLDILFENHKQKYNTD
jgi:hypothetical protein